MSAFGAKGKGKAKGKDAGNPSRGAGHLLEKTRLSAEKFTGVVVSWRGKFGFVKPDEEIEHEKAHLHSGNLYVRAEDLEGCEKLDVGAPVEFHINEDESGLGAEEVAQIGEAPEGAAAGKPAGKVAGKSAGKAAGKVAGNGSAGAKGGAKGWGGAAAPAPWTKGGKAGAKDWTSYGPAQPVFSGFGKSGAAAKGKGMDKGKGKGKGKSSREKNGHLLPRTRITAEKFQGTVAGWKGKYGWVTPAEAIEHEKASLHNGDLFVGVSELEGGIEKLEVGQTVEFHIWEDSSGLGADEVEVLM